MKTGTLYGIGVGPGRPEWMTLEAVRTLQSCGHVFAPRAKDKSESLALDIAREHLPAHVQIHEMTFPMSRDKSVLRSAWSAAAKEIATVLRLGEDACFLTIGDAMLYSTFIYLQREVAALDPSLPIRVIPGIPAFIASASLAGIPLGEGTKPITIVPVSGELQMVRDAIATGGTSVLMKVGAKLDALLPVLDECGALPRSVLVARAGLDGQEIHHLHDIVHQEKKPSAYLSLVLVPTAVEDQGSLFAQVSSDHQNTLQMPTEKGDQ